MRPLTARALLGAWELGARQPAGARALPLLAAACPESTWEDFATLPLGRRDAQLLSLREQIFGPRLECVVTCPECRARADLVFPVMDLRVEAGAPPLVPLSAEALGYSVEFRLPNALDMADLPTLDVEGARRWLFERCVLKALKGEVPVTAAEVPAEVVDEVSAQMERADGQACIELSTLCPGCGHACAAVLDIGAFLWTEVAAWVRRTLRDVHALASAYHWSEVDILAMSPWKRRMYLEMVAG